MGRSSEDARFFGAYLSPQPRQEAEVLIDDLSAGTLRTRVSLQSCRRIPRRRRRSRSSRRRSHQVSCSLPPSIVTDVATRSSLVLVRRKTASAGAGSRLASDGKRPRCRSRPRCRVPHNQLVQSEAVVPRQKRKNESRGNRSRRSRKQVHAHVHPAPLPASTSTTESSRAPRREPTSSTSTRRESPRCAPTTDRKPSAPPSLSRLDRKSVV